jgi:D-alanine transaminase
VNGEPGRWCLQNGQIVPFGEARVSPLDRGLLFGDAAYEAIKVLGGRPLWLDRHLERLAASLAALRIAPPDGLEVELAALVAANRLGDGVIYLQVTRGVAPRRSHLPPPGLVPTVIGWTSPLELVARPENEPGLTAITRADDRWRHADVKTTAQAASVLGKLAAAEAGAAEVIYLGADGELREGGNTNLFVRDAGGWHTHPAGPAILAGVTRAVLLEEGVRFGVAVAERAPRLADRRGWCEAFLSGTTTGVRGLVALDGEPLGDGAVGEETRRFARWLAAAELAEARRAEHEIPA